MIPAILDSLANVLNLPPWNRRRDRNSRVPALAGCRPPTRSIKSATAMFIAGWKKYAAFSIDVVMKYGARMIWVCESYQTISFDE